MELQDNNRCAFDRLISLAGGAEPAEHALSVLRNAGSCSALLSCPRRLGCSWMAMILATRLSEAAIAAAEHDRVLALSA
ncbi:hypothetical protein [Magnetospirillum sp. 15-1]|uniref:hypothetical protein n=1 Tax=Magnetospirillum sp. 15-1 TaxID=1979370 RepID=UPI000BBC980A|nr:hypothetical protein [Magnetospirillum sp. 15-1]